MLGLNGMEITQNSRPNVIITKEKEKAVSSHKKTFNRLIKKVQELQGQQEKVACELDETLQFYDATVRPDELLFLQHLTELIDVAYAFYKTAKGFSKNELKIFKAWLIEKLGQVCSMHEQKNIPTTIKAIFKELHGIGYDESFAQEVEEERENFQEQFKGFFGEDIDLSDIDFTGSQEDIMRNIFMKIGKTATDFKEKYAQAPKTKKQIEKEAKKQALEEMQNKSLHTMYTQLARVLHPDLERDAEKRVLKEELMKKLTVAYKKNDLYSLLKIEIEGMNYSVDKMQSHDDDEIKVYNAVLKDQIQELELANGMLVMHPRYIPIQKFYQNGFNSISTLQRLYHALKRSIRDVQGMVAGFKTSQAKAIVEEIIQDQIAMTKSRGCSCGSC
jgi:hypothetical protein